MMVIPATDASQIAPVSPLVEQCAWCWPLLYPGQPYPQEWSSTICVEHAAWFERLRAGRRERRSAGSLQRTDVREQGEEKEACFSDQ